jgi:hypothetical protein
MEAMKTKKTKLVVKNSRVNMLAHAYPKFCSKFSNNFSRAYLIIPHRLARYKQNLKFSGWRAAK